MTFILSEGARLRMTEGGAWQSALPAPLRDRDAVGMMIPMSPIPRRGRTVTCGYRGWTESWRRGYATLRANWNESAFDLITCCRGRIRGGLDETYLFQ